MLNQKQNTHLVFILFFILAGLISAYIIEYKLGHEPCNLCIYERIPYFLAIFLIIEALFFKKNLKITLLILSIIFVTSSALAFYHFGIEQGFFSESLVCNLGENSKAVSAQDLLKELENKIVSCKDVTFRILGLSLATFNTIISFLISAIIVRVVINYEKN